MGSTEGPTAADPLTQLAPADIPPEMREATAFVVDMGGTELLHKVLALFSSTAVERMNELRHSAEGNDRVRVSRLAHAMKGSAAQVGAEALRRVAAQLEADAVGLSAEDVAVSIDLLERQLEHARALLQVVKHSTPGRGAAA